MPHSPATAIASATQVVDAIPLIPIGLGGAVVAVVAAVAILRRGRRAPSPTSAGPQGTESQHLAAAAPVAKALEDIPEVEVANREELEAAVQERTRLAKAKREEIDALGAGISSSDARGRLEAEWKELEENRKKAEYRLRRATEVAERERRRALLEAKAAAEAEEKVRLEAERVDREAAEAEAQRKKVEAVAGRTLAEGLDKTRHGFMARLGQLFGGNQPIDDKILADLEEVLFSADIGVKTAQRLLEATREKARSRELTDGTRLKAALRIEIESILVLDHAGEAMKLSANPTVIMVVGVNGAGKTTTIGKLAAQFIRQGQGVVMAAGDTYRAAATEQLAVWAERAGAVLVKGAEGSDPGAVAFDAVKKAQSTGAKVVLCDTAGRLHTNVQLMDELRKVKRVLEKAQSGAPHEVLLILDSTNGQNAIVQARQFHEALGVTGIALTKLDGTAKGGVIIGICDELKVPVRYVGIGETIEDLRTFQPREFVDALFQ